MHLVDFKEQIPPHNIWICVYDKKNNPEKGYVCRWKKCYGWEFMASDIDIVEFTHWREFCVDVCEENC